MVKLDVSKKYGLTQKGFDTKDVKLLALSETELEDYTLVDDDEVNIEIKKKHPNLSDEVINKFYAKIPIEKLCRDYLGILLQLGYAKELLNEYDVLETLKFRLEHCLKPYLNDVNGFYSEIIGDELTLYVETNNDPPQILIRIVYSEKNQQLYIPNIMVHKSMKHKGFGRALIKQCLIFATSIRCDLLVVDLTDSFHQRLLKRKAVQCDNIPDGVFITWETDLS